MRLILSFLLLSQLFSGSFGGIARAECDARRFLHAAPQVRSRWLQSSEVKLIQGEYRSLMYPHPSPLMKVYAGSYADQRPELLRLIDDVESLQLYPRDFKDEFRASHGVDPSNENFVEFYLSRMELFKSAIREYASILKPENEALADQIYRNFSEQISSKHDLLRKLNVASVEVSAVGLHQLVIGHLTELYAVATLPQVTQAGVTLAQMPGMLESMNEKLKRAIGNPEIEKRFPTIFQNARLKYVRGVSEDEYRAQIVEWVGRKEIDVIRESDGKTSWVEVKHNSRPFDLGHFTSRGSKGKSALDQILEDKQIIEFLGLSDKIQLEYLATGGMDADVRALLKSNGVRVIRTP